MDTVQDLKQAQLPNEIGATSLQIQHREDFSGNAGSQESHMNNKRMLEETDSPLDDVLNTTSETIHSENKKKKTQNGADTDSPLTASFHQHEKALNSEFQRNTPLSPFQSNVNARNVLSANQFVPYATEHSSGLIIPTTTPNVPNSENQNATNVMHSPYPISGISSHEHEKTISSESASDSSSSHHPSLEGNHELHMRPPISGHLPLSLPGNTFSFPLGSILVNPSSGSNGPMPPHPLHRPLDMPHSIPPFPQPPTQSSDFPVIGFHPNSPLELQYLQQRYMETLRDMMHNQSERSAPPKAPPKQPQTNPVFHSVYSAPFMQSNANPPSPSLPHPLSMLPNPNVSFSHSIPSPQNISNNNNIIQNNNNSASFGNANTNSPNNRFVLLEQPNVRQRKSYKNENRYLLPNPLVVALRDDLTEKNFRISDGIATVRLVNADGDELPTGKNNLLETADGGLAQNLDSSAAAHFSLKILETSDGAMFRLLITVQYNFEASPGAPLLPTEEKILSRPFQVFSNRKKNNKERPVVIDIKPSEAPCNSETEVWIKGKGFGDRVLVLFGDKPGRIIETAENLLTVLAPARFELSSDSTVVVAVSNKYPHDLLTAEKQLNFTYIAPHV